MTRRAPTLDRTKPEIGQAYISIYLDDGQPRFKVNPANPVRLNLSVKSINYLTLFLSHRPANITLVMTSQPNEHAGRPHPPVPPSVALRVAILEPPRSAITGSARLVVRVLRLDLLRSHGTAGGRCCSRASSRWWCCVCVPTAKDDARFQPLG